MMLPIEHGSERIFAMGGRHGYKILDRGAKSYKKVIIFGFRIKAKTFEHNVLKNDKK